MVKAKCLVCGQILVSEHRHHFVHCDCENNAFLDGGGDPYYRIGAVDLNKVKIIDNDEDEGKNKNEK